MARHCTTVPWLLVALLLLASTSASICKVKLLMQSIDVGGIYFRALPAGWCSPLNKTTDIKFKVHPPGSSPNSPPHLITVEDDEERLKSLFKPNLPTAVYVHGFFEGAKASSVRAFRTAYLIRGDHNFMAVNWQPLANAPWYPSATSNFPLVGRELALLLDRLVSVGAIRLDTLHLIGFSLGAHVCAVTGRHLTVGHLPRITALDPAYPLITHLPREHRLDVSTADFVDVIHTCGGLYGYYQPVGHVDFYPNGGIYIQPGCWITLAPITCSHWRSWRFYTESLQGGEFVATACDNYADYKRGKCNANKTIMMGIDADQTARGVFYLSTSWESPYSVQQ